MTLSDERGLIVTTEDFMKHIAWIVPAVLLAAVAVFAASKAPKVKDTVPFARSWDAAIDEAKLLNVPIVVHSHGFY